MLFYIGNNSDNYGPDRFNFIGAEFRVNTYADGAAANFRQPGGGGTGLFGKAALDYMGEQWEDETPRFIIKNSGNVGIGEAGPQFKLHVNGTIGATDDITAFHSSDKRLKNNLIPIKDPLEKLKKINGYTFVWKENEHHSNKGNDVGVIAQEIEEILPEITTTRENGYKAVRYEKLTPFLISCIKTAAKTD